MVERKFSKTVANANRVTWTQNEVMPVPYTLQGLVYDGAELARLRIHGREIQCRGFRVDFQVPAQRPDVQIAIGLYSADNVLQGSLLYINGSEPGSDKLFTAPVAMPPGSLWKAKVTKVRGDELDLPEGLTFTYLLNYANAPSNSREWTSTLPTDGIGYWGIGQDFVIS